MFARFIALSVLLVVAGSNIAVAANAPDSAKHRGSGRMSSPIVIVEESAGCNRQCSACNPTGC